MQRSNQSHFEVALLQPIANANTSIPINLSGESEPNVSSKFNSPLAITSHRHFVESDRESTLLNPKIPYQCHVIIYQYVLVLEGVTARLSHSSLNFCMDISNFRKIFIIFKVDTWLTHQPLANQTRYVHPEFLIAWFQFLASSYASSIAIKHGPCILNRTYW